MIGPSWSNCKMDWPRSILLSTIQDSFVLFCMYLLWSSVCRLYMTTWSGVWCLIFRRFASDIDRTSLRIQLAAVGRILSLHTINQSGFEIYIKFTHRSCIAHSMMAKRFRCWITVLTTCIAFWATCEHWTYIRYLYKCYSLSSLGIVSVRFYKHVRDCEFWKLAKIHKQPWTKGRLKTPSCTWPRVDRSCEGFS